MTVLLVTLGSVCALIAFGYLAGFLLYSGRLAHTLLTAIPPLAAPRVTALNGGESCSFTARDGLLLKGTYLHTPAPLRLGVVAYCHELTGDRWLAADYTEDLRQRGFDIFCFDFRNHGQSTQQPGYQPVPWLSEYDLADVQGALDYLCSRPDADPRGVGLIGVSKGAAAALYLAGHDRRIRAVVSDGAFSTDSLAVHYIRRWMQFYTVNAWLYRFLPNCVLRHLARSGRWLAGRRLNCRFVELEGALKRIEQPVLLIHGEHDSYVPVTIAAKLRRYLPKQTRLWIAPGARHNGAIQIAPEEYQRRLARFFLKHLATGRRGHSVASPMRQENQHDLATSTL